MALFPYNDEEEEERRRRMLTPPLNPNAPPVLPDTGTPSPRMPPPAPGIPGGVPPPPTPVVFDQPTRLQRMDVERDAYMRTTPGRGRSALTGALRGLAQGLTTGQGLAGAVGGAIGGGIGGAIDPRGLREQQFNQQSRPKLQERFTLEDEERERGVRQRIEEAQLARIPREAAMDDARLKQIGVQNEVALENARGQRELRESQRKLNDARAEAERTGRPQKIDRVNVETGQIETILVYPSAPDRVLGGSAPAAISAARNKSAENRVAAQQSGATGRAAMAQSGQNTRQAERLAVQAEGGAAGGSKLRKPSTGGVSSEQIQQIIAKAKKRGKTVTEAQVRERLKAREQ